MRAVSTRSLPAALFRARRVVPRGLHPGAWWLWAVCLATAASRTNNPVLLALLAAAAGYVVAARRTDAPWARAYGAFLRIGLVVLGIRVVVFAVFGAPVPGHVIVTLPQVGLPSWAAGVRIGGPITAEGLLAATYEGVQLAVMLGCIGAANALASPARLLRCLPGALYEAGVAVVVALSFAPHAVAAVTRVRAARRLRGRPDRGLRGLRGMAMPVLESALERSIELAASMDSRGYGRRADIGRRARRLTAGLILAGLLGLCAGVYGLLDAGSPGWISLALLAAGTSGAVGGLVLGSRRAVRSRYRPDRWLGPEWAVAACGILCAACFVVAASRGGLVLPQTPLCAPGVPLLAALGVAFALAPAWATPPPLPTVGSPHAPAGEPA